PSRRLPFEALSMSPATISRTAINGAIPSGADACGTCLGGLAGRRRHEDAASLQSPSVEAGHRVVNRVERIRVRVQANLALRSERHQLLEVCVGADEVADERDL